MTTFKRIRGTAVALAAFGTTIPNMPVLADGSAPVQRPGVTTVAPKIFDISLSKGGTFQGRVVDHTGAPMEGSQVSIIQNNTEVGRMVTDKTGTFTASNLKPGVYSVASGNTTGTYRLWSENTAPPSAKPQGLLVMGENGARGQFGYIDGYGLLFVGALAAGALAVGVVALVRADQANNKAPASP